MRRLENGGSESKKGQRAVESVTVELEAAGEQND